MNKNNLKKIAYELNNELSGNTKALIFVVFNKYLKIHKIYDKEKWLRNFLGFEKQISNKTEQILDKNIREFENIDAISWLYQYFIAEEKSRVFNNLMKGIKVEKKDIPYATQLFTPDWIVRFLVDNSLGKLIETKKLEEIKFIDPCQGTGNILIYAFDVFYQAYIRAGYSRKSAILNILTKNLYGIDIDENASIITQLVLLLKAECFDNNVINKMNIICIKSSREINLGQKGKNLLIRIFEDADEYGSLIKVNDEVKKYDLLNRNEKIDKDEANNRRFCLQ